MFTYYFGFVDDLGNIIFPLHSVYVISIQYIKVLSSTAVCFSFPLWSHFLLVVTDQSSIIMASKKVFDAMEAKDWNKVKDLIAATSWTPQALQEKHTVCTELAPLGNDSPSHDTEPISRCNKSILFENICRCGISFQFFCFKCLSCFLVCVFFFCTYIHRIPHIQGDLPSYQTFHILTYYDCIDYYAEWII